MKTVFSVLLLSALSTLAANNPLALTEFHCGATFGFYARAGYFYTSEAFDEVDEMVKTGVKWVVVVPTVWQDKYCSTRQYADFEKTPDDIELVDIINYIHSKGLRVQLRPMLECQDGTGRLGVIVGDDWERMPGHPREYCARWFASMKARSVHYAKLAERTKCELYCLDSELDRFTDKNVAWKSVVAAVRKVYSGPVTSCHTVHTPFIDFERAFSKKDHWFHDLDLLLVSYYAPAGKSDDRQHSIDEMKTNLLPARDRMRRLASLYGKPIVFGECGCSSSAGSAAAPSSLRWHKPYDPDEQARYMEAFFQVFASEPWCHGFYWWKWDNHVPQPAEVDSRKGFTVRGKAAQDVMRNYYLTEIPRLRMQSTVKESQ